MSELPNQFVIDFTQVFNVWVTLKVVAITFTGLYAAFGKGEGLNRLFKVAVFGILVYMLTGCVGPDDSIISQSKTQQAQIQANAQQQQLQAQVQAAQNLLSQQQQQQQATALQLAQAQAQTARDDAQRQQAEALAQQAQAQQLQAGAMNNAIAELGNANERANNMASMLWIGGLGVIGLLVFLKFYLPQRPTRATGEPWPKYDMPRIEVSQYDKMSGTQLRLLAEQLGYLVTRDAEGRWAIVDRSTLKRLDKRQLLLELKKGG